MKNIANDDDQPQISENVLEKQQERENKEVKPGHI